MCMKYTIELVCSKGNTFREFEGTEKGARFYAKNLVIKKGKDEWDANIFENRSGLLTHVGKMYYDHEKWYYSTKKGYYTVNTDGSIRKILWK